MLFLQSARTRLVAANALISFLATVLVIGTVYWTADRIIDAETRSVVDAELKGLADSYTDQGILGLARAIDRRVESTEEPDAVYLLTDRFGQPVAGNLGAWPPTVEPGRGWVEIELIRTDSDRSVPIAAASIQLRGNERLLVGRDASARHSFAGALWQATGLSLLVALVLSMLIGWLLTNVVFNRVGEISKAAEDIMMGDLSRRMPRQAGKSELDELSKTLNSMLDKIENLVSNMRMTTDSLAHDLRSPLTRLRGHIERLSLTDLPETAREAISERAVSEINHILRVFADLTEIARAEAGIGRSEFTEIDLSDLVAGVASFYQPVAEEQGKTILTRGAKSLILGHSALLKQAISNILENALRYAPEGSEITVSVRSDGDDAELLIADQGVGIPAADRDRVLKPFVTLDPSRTDKSNGLGLALMASVVRMHDGTTELQDNHPGLKVIIRIPARQSVVPVA